MPVRAFTSKPDYLIKENTMLDRDYNENETATVETAAPAVVNQTTSVAPANAASPKRDFSEIVGALYKSDGSYTLPIDAVTGCTIVKDSIKLGKDLEKNVGDYLIVEPLNLTKYEKLNLGTQDVAKDDENLKVSCYDGETVTFEDAEYTKDQMLALAKDRGYDKAKWEVRAVLHAFYLDSEKDDKLDLAEDDRLLAIYLSPSSYRSWVGFEKTSKFMGHGNQLKLSKVEGKSDKFTWTYFKFNRTNFEGEVLAA